MLVSVFGCFRTSRHLFVKHVSAFLFLFLLRSPTITLQQQLIAFTACIMLDDRFVNVLPCYFLYCIEIRSNG